jgi:uncharacterized protein (TIGR04141 family)
MGARSFSTEFLKKNYVARLDSIGFQKERWPLYKCLYGEVDYNGRNYILNNGKWYALEQGFVAQVDTDIGQIGESNVTLPPYQDASEGHYNIRAASINPDFYSLDAQQIMFGGGHSSIEFCDLYCRTKKIIHVKRYSGSSTLSHLFSQGTVSAEIFLSDSGFRSNVNELLPDTHKFTDPLIRPNPQEFEVVYAIVSKSANPLNLPFFSKVNLRNAFNRLNLMGFDCKLNKIQNAND